MAQNIEMQCKQSDGSYETLLPKSQANLLEINNTDLGSHLGGNTTVEGSLDYLSRMYAYWWKREIRIPTYNISRGDVVYNKGYSYGTMYHYNATQYLTFYPKVGNTLSTTRDGTVYIADQKDFTVQAVWESIRVEPELTISGGGLSGTTTNPNDISGKYWNINGTICCEYRQDELSLNRWVSQEGTPVIAKFWIGYEERTLYKMVSSVSGYTDGGTDYVYSFSRDAYPDSGTVENYTYTYLGIPFENAMKDGPK